MTQQSSINTGLDILPATTDKSNFGDIFKLYNAIKILADSIDLYTGELVPTGTESSAGLTYLRVQKISRAYLQASVSITAGQMVGINGSSQIVLGTVGTVVGFAPAAITAGNYGEIDLLGLCTAYTGLTPGAMYYAAAAGAITAVPSAQKIGFAITTTTLFVNPA